VQADFQIGDPILGPRQFVAQIDQFLCLAVGAIGLGLARLAPRAVAVSAS
jgi:hypothetical protein